MVSGTDASDLTGQPSDRRRLIVVVHADVVGYSRLIGLDDIGTLDRMRRLRREVIDPALDAYGGRIVNTGGDALLMVFDSVDGAVRSALRVQEQVPVVGGEVPPDRAIRFRIGINVGDVIPDGTDVHGDVVNVAARLQAECSPGGICMSRAVRDHMQGRLDVAFEALGPLNLKNITHPVEAFMLKVATTVGTLQSVERSLVHGTDALSLPDKPSIAVLPFANLSADPEQEYFSDGVADDIVTELSRSRSLFVIARNSSFTYKGNAIDVKRVGRELGVRYVLEGSVRRGGTRIRVNAQLIDAETGNHIWADRYDRDLIDVFAVQDEITIAVTTAILPAVMDAEQRRALRKRPENLGAWEAYQRGLWHATRLDKEENQRSRSFFQQSINLDPTFSLPHQGLARTYLDDVSHYFVLNATDGFNLAFPLALHAVELDQSDANAHGLLGYSSLIHGDLTEGLVRADMALNLNANSVVAHQTKGSCLIFLGRYQVGIRTLQEYLRLNPRDPWGFRAYVHLSIAHYALAEYEACIEAGQCAVQANPHANGGYRWIGAALGQLGRVEEAQRVIRRASNVLAPMSFGNYALNRGPWLPKHVHEQMIDGLRKAGWQG